MSPLKRVKRCLNSLRHSSAQPAFLASFRREAAQTGVNTRRATKGPAGILGSMSRNPRKRNAVDSPVSAGAAESW
jgi:hypothetical protein